MLAIFAGMTVIALGFPAQAQLMPLLVGVPGTLMALVQLIKEVQVPAGAPPVAAPEAQDERRRERKMFLWLALFLAGILAVGFLWAAPLLVFAFWDIAQFPFGGTSLLITVGVALETMKQIDSQLMMRNYEGFLK